MPSTDSAAYLGEPLLTSPGQPLRVAVYDRISRGIRAGVLRRGQLLPRETELCVSLGVSRTVVREALMLLEEDGLILTRRGVGRFVAESLPAEKGDAFEPLDVLFAHGATRLDVRVLEHTRQRTTDFVSDLLGLRPDDEFWFREVVLIRDGRPAALVQEYVPVEPLLASSSPALAEGLDAAAREDATLLRALSDRPGVSFSPGVCRIAANLAGPTRGAHLDVKPGDPVLVLTQTAEVDGQAVLITKAAIPPAFAHLSVTQWTLAPGA